MLPGCKVRVGYERGGSCSQRLKLTTVNCLYQQAVIDTNVTSVTRSLVQSTLATLEGPPWLKAGDAHDLARSPPQVPFPHALAHYVIPQPEHAVLLVCRPATRRSGDTSVARTGRSRGELGATALDHLGKARICVLSVRSCVIAELISVKCQTCNIHPGAG